jgi:predicted ATPase
MLTTLAIANYRSVRQLVLGLGRLNVITGGNGSGKSNIYRALQLLAEVAQGRVVQSLAREGGLASTLWAGPEQHSRAMKSGLIEVQGTRRKEPVHLRLGFASDEFGYGIDLGLPTPSASIFTRDPHIKRECVWAGELLRPASQLVDRTNSLVRVKGDTAASRAWQVLHSHLSPFDSMMTCSADPRSTPELLALHEHMRHWRFYDHLRTDRDAPARAQIGTFTPALAGDGADLAAAVQTIFEIGEGDAFQSAIADAFDGASITIQEHQTRLELCLQQPGLLRPLTASELSDGTLRYILLAAALLTPRPPPLMVLNEPETSLHPDLLPPLARLIVKASEQTQIIVVTHAARLVAALDGHDHQRFSLVKELGQTAVVDYSPPRWEWVAR